MFKKIMSAIMLGMLLLMMTGCSNDEKTTNSQTDDQASHLELANLDVLVAAVAPPEFTAPEGVPASNDSMEIWTSGDYPLLEKVFGSRDNQALYRNINDFQRNLDILTMVVPVNEDGEIVAGEFTDSAMVEIDGDSVMVHYTATITALSEATAIPAPYQTILGESIDVDYLVTMAVDAVNGRDIQFGLTVNDSVQSLLQYEHGTGDIDQDESSLIYATIDLNDSTFVFKGVGRVAYVNDDLFTYGYNMTSASTSDFAYRMSWFARESQMPQSLLGCMVGGGNKDVEFALKYRQFMPADTSVIDSVCMYDQLFGPNYSEGSGLISDYADYLDDGLIYTYDAIPMEQIVSPWAE